MPLKFRGETFSISVQLIVDEAIYGGEVDGKDFGMEEDCAKKERERSSLFLRTRI